MPNKRLIFGILILFGVNLIQAFFTPISEDEAYYWLWSQNLDWGYFDHPPMVAWWISVGYNFFQNELGVRLLTVVFNSFGLYMLLKILEPKTQNQIRLFFGIIGSILVIQLFGFLTTPDAPLLFFTILYLFSLKKFLEKSVMLSTLLLAISMAGLMYSKYHGILVIVFTLLPIFKIWWKNPKFYLTVLGSLIFYAPHLNWLIQNDFVPICYHFLERSSDEVFEFRKLFNYLGIYFLGAAPLLAYFIWKAILQFKSENSFQKSIWWLSILPGIFFFFSIFKDNVQPQWLLISFVAMGLTTYFYFRNQENLKWILGLSFGSLGLILILRTILMIPSISPFEKNKIFGTEAGKFQPEFAVFEKYQEASVYKFYNPENQVAVHRTLGNRKSQFSLWGWEEELYGKTIGYISPWVKAENSFKGYKNRNYYLKEISNYQPFDGIEIQTIDHLMIPANEEIELEIEIINHQKQAIRIGGNTEFQLTINYFKNLQYEIEHRFQIPLDEMVLQPNEPKKLKISFQNTDKKGEFKACLGLNYQPVGTSYLSKPIRVLVN